MGRRLVFCALPTLAVAATIATQVSAATVDLLLTAGLGGANSDSAFFNGETDRASDVASALIIDPGRFAIEELLDEAVEFNQKVAIS